MKKIKEVLLKVKEILLIIKTFIKKIFAYVTKYTGIDWLKNKFIHLPNKYKKMVYGILFIMPWLIGLVYISLPIIIRSIRMALSDKYYFITGVGWQITGKWYEFTQFKRIFADEPYHVSLIVDTLQDVAVVVPLVVIFALILALMLNQKVRGIAIFRTIFFIPVILLSGNMLMNFERNALLTVPAIASGEISGFMHEYLPGIFNDAIFGAFGKIVLILWLSGVQILIFLAGLQKMDKSIYEAARIDGASIWELFWKITLPALIPLIYLNIIYTTIIYSNLSNNAIVQIINVHSDEAQMLGGTLTDEINYGRAYSAALSWLLFFIQLAIIGVYSLIVRLSSKRYD
ncbi:MAG: sugar ABC transporter permease [Candidatus Izemoplasmatales bacterium]